MDLHLARISSTLVFSALVATGCGGGGGSSNNTAPANSTPVAITQDNAVAIASGVLSGGSFADSYTGMNTYAKAGTSSSTDKDASYQRISDLVRNNVIRAMESRKSTASLPAGAVITDTPTPCHSGSFYTSWNDADGDLATSTAGDSASIVFDNCTYTSAYSTTVENGSLTFTLNDMQGDPLVDPDWSMSVSFSANLSVSDTYSDGSSTHMSIVGGATLATAYVQSTTTTSGSMSGSSLKMSMSYSDPTYGSGSGSVELADFNFASSSNNSTYTADIDYTLRSSDLGGSVTVATSPVFSGTVFNPPTSGKMVITGAGGSSLTLTAYDGYVTISVNGGAAKQYFWYELGVSGEL